MKLIKKTLEPFLIPGVKYYLEKDRYFRYRGHRYLVKKGVFHPLFFFSSKVLLKYLQEMEWKAQKVLELGAGCGFISLSLSRQGARVVASDISPIAIQNLRENLRQDPSELQIIKSDLFDDIPAQIFEWIIINPPYYPKNPQNELEQALFCGASYEYFEKLFFQIPDYLNTESKLIMILSEDCNIPHIQSIATKNNLHWQEIKSVKVWWEKNYLFEIKKK